MLTNIRAITASLMMTSVGPDSSGDFMLLSYDPQIGRWLQNDPFDQFASGYVGMGADPANNFDPTGGMVPGVSSTGLADVVSYCGK